VLGVGHLPPAARLVQALELREGDHSVDLLVRDRVAVSEIDRLALAPKAAV
jgi:hypothetical protein